MTEPMHDYLKFAAYGRWGTGKTRQIGMLCDGVGADKVYIISADKGLNSIAGKFLPANRFEVNSVDEYRKIGGELFKRLKENTDRDVWLCIDGASRIFQWMASQALDEADDYGARRAMGEPHEAMPVHLKPYKRFANAEGVIDQQRLYGPIGTDITRSINGFMRASANVYITLGEDETTRDRTAGPPYTPDIPGKVGLKELMRTFDYIGRMVLADGAPMLQIDPEKVNFYWSRTRDNREVTGKLEGEIRNFNLAMFAKRMRGVK